MSVNLITNGDFQQPDNGGWVCGPGCTIQEQPLCTGRCALVRAPQTISQLLELDQILVSQPLNLTIQALVSSITSDPKTSVVNVLLTLDNTTIGHNLSVAPSGTTGTFSTYSQTVTVYSTSVPIIIHLLDNTGVYDCNLYIQRVTLASISTELPPSTTSYSPSEISRIVLEEGRAQAQKTFTTILVPVAILTLFLILGGIWILRRQNRQQAQNLNALGTAGAPAAHTTYELPEVKNQVHGGVTTRPGIQEPTLVIETDALRPTTVELPQSPVNHSPEHPQMHDAARTTSIINDPIGLYATTYRNMISRELEEKLRAIGFTDQDNPDAIREEEWLNRFDVGPFELERLREIFYGRNPRLLSNDIPGQDSMISITSTHPFRQGTSTTGTDNFHHRGVYLAGWAESHRTRVSPILENKLRAACYLPTDDPDKLAAGRWQTSFGVGPFELEILRGLFREE